MPAIAPNNKRKQNMKCGLCKEQVYTAPFVDIEKDKVKWSIQCYNTKCNWELEVDRETAIALNHQVIAAYLSVIADGLSGEQGASRAT